MSQRPTPTRPRPATANVVSGGRRWDLVAAVVAVVAVAAAILGYAVVQVRNADAEKVTSVDQIGGVTSAQYTGGVHVATTVDYDQSPPIGGPHDPEWADCTGTVYDVDIRNENAVHALEHGAVWITYDPARVQGSDLDHLVDLVSGESGRMLSPRPGLPTAVSVQSWDHQLTAEEAADPRIAQFADLLTLNPSETPEPGATCENPQFLAYPLVQGDQSRASTGAPAPAAVP